jgi:thiol-disulfide isomerase/thioredoxin
MGRATWIHLVVAIGLVLAIGNASGQAPPQSESRTSIRRADVPLVIKAVEEWETIPIEQAGLPQVDANEVIAGAQDWLKGFEKLTSWEARYETTYTQGSPSPFREGMRFQMISDGRRWYSRQQTKSPDSQPSQAWEAACDGNTVRMLWPDKKEAQVQKADENVGWGSAPTLPAFFPQIPADRALRQGEGLPNLLDSLKGSGIRLLPVCARVNERPCYVLERTVRQERPVFRSQQEADQWDKEHEDEQVSSDGSIPRSIVIDPAAKPEDKTSSTVTTRLAVDPKLGFAVVRWALGYEGHRPGLDMTIFPDRELIYQDFRKTDAGVQMPFQVEFTRYRTTYEGKREVSQQYRLGVESFVVRSEWEPALFSTALLEGYNVVDTIRGIVYTTDFSQERIDRLLAAAKARDAFYRRLREGPAPALQASTWIGSDPINLAGHKGRPIILHFWAITCGPCIYELPRLQAQYGDTLKSTNGPLFISIHSHAQGRDLDKVRQIAKSQGITFPVMIDSPHANWKYWGDTSYRYRVFSMPSEIRIDENGRVAEVEKTLISESSWWMNTGQDK